jgi:hypothetical protein
MRQLGLQVLNTRQYHNRSSHLHALYVPYPPGSCVVQGSADPVVICGDVDSDFNLPSNVIVNVDVADSTDVLPIGTGNNPHNGGPVPQAFKDAAGTVPDDGAFSGYVSHSFFFFSQGTPPLARGNGNGLSLLLFSM